jgi:hypothetical protein
MGQTNIYDIESKILAQFTKNGGLNGLAGKFDLFCHPNFNRTLDKYLLLVNIKKLQKNCVAET